MMLSIAASFGPVRPAAPLLGNGESWVESCLGFPAFDPGCL